MKTSQIGPSSHGWSSTISNFLKQKTLYQIMSRVMAYLSIIFTETKKNSGYLVRVCNTFTFNENKQKGSQRFLFAVKAYALVSKESFSSLTRTTPLIRECFWRSNSLLRQRLAYLSSLVWKHFVRAGYLALLHNEMLKFC